MYLAKLIMYLAICHVYKFFSLFKNCIVYLAIFAMYLAKPFHSILPPESSNSSWFDLFSCV